MMAQRRTLPPLNMPPYLFEDVPAAKRDVADSVVVRVDDREKWMESLSEMLLLCNEAAARRIEKVGLVNTKCSDGTQTKPLGLEYMADRLDTDDPISGFQVRSIAEGWLQGFITTTTFTVWQRNFRWDSHAPESGISEDDMSNRKWDQDNSLSMELDAQERSGNPDAEGIIWPNCAELSLLGGLGCGTMLVRLLMEQLEADGKFDYVIVQATDNSVAFYETFGFVRVGAVARYRGAAESEWGSSTLPLWVRNKRIRFVVGGGGAGGPRRRREAEHVQGAGDGAGWGHNGHACEVGLGGGRAAVDGESVGHKRGRALDASSEGEGTLIQPPGPDVDWDNHAEWNVALRRAQGFVPYCHWTFPTQSVEDLHPSYMMAKRIVRGRRAGMGSTAAMLGNKITRNAPAVKVTQPLQPLPRALALDRRQEMSAEEIKEKSMVNKVVTVPSSSDPERYYYVLHYIIDMDWCHLVPLQASGVFLGGSFRAGRPRYKLVPEGQARELDVPASRCRVARAYTISKTNDADREVWDMVHDHEADEYARLLAEERREQRMRKSTGSIASASDAGSEAGSAAGGARVQAAWEHAASRIMKRLWKHKFSWPFCEPVDPVKLNIPDYLDVIKTPMDFGTVCDRLEQRAYGSAAEWAADVRLTLHNAMAYNGPENQIHIMAKELEGVFGAHLSRLPPGSLDASN